MNFLKYFFRAVPDGPQNWVGKPIFLVLLVFLVAGSVYIINALPTYSRPLQERIKKTIAGTLWANQIVYIPWLIFGGGVEDPLPLYYCRIAQILLPFVAFLPKRTFNRTVFHQGIRTYLVCIAIFGGVLATAYPSPDPYAFPHLSSYTFVVGHLGLIFLAMALVASHVKFSKQSFIVAQIILLGSNLSIASFCLMSGANYAFFLEPPLFSFLRTGLGQFGYIIFVCGVYALFLSISYIFVRAFSPRKYHDKTTNVIS